MTLNKKSEAAKLISKISPNDMLKITEEQIVDTCESCQELSFFEEEIDLKENEKMNIKSINPKAKNLLLLIQGKPDVSMSTVHKVLNLFDTGNTSVRWGFGFNPYTQKDKDTLYLSGLYGS